MRCPNCDRENPTAARFCVFCGAPLTQTAAATAPAPPSLSVPPPAPSSLAGAAPTAPMPSEILNLPQAWRLPYLAAIGHIRFGNRLRWIGVGLGAALSLLFLIPILQLAGEAARAGAQVEGIVIWLVLATIIWGMVIGAGLYGLGMIARTEGFQLLSMLNMELQSLPDALLNPEEGAEGEKTRMEVLQAAHRLRQQLLSPGPAALPGTSESETAGPEPLQKPCPWCGALVYVTAKACPSCFRPLPGRT